MLALTAFYQDPLTLFVVGLLLMILFFWYFATEIERRKRNVGTVLLIGVCGLCLLAVTPPQERLKGGIDILGGSSFSLRIQPKETEEGEKMPITREQVQQAISVIAKRLDATGAVGPQIARQGEDRISLQMPGVEPERSQEIRATLEKVAKLELREVHPRTGEVGADGKNLAQRVTDGDEIVPGYRAYVERGKDEDGTAYARPILLNRRMALGGMDIANATPSPSRADAVAITLNSVGTDKMIALTKDMRQGSDRIAIVLDGDVISAPTVQQTPLGKQFEVSGLSEPGEVQSLANALMNPLENALVVESASEVSATLGSAVVKQGIWAGICGLAVTFVFILLYYRTAGIIAAFGLIVNGIILFGVMAMFGFPFTLPGICGIILSIGMAVDANVLIYERLREELVGGKVLKSAIGSAYDKAFTAIFDANITSLITAIILYATTTGAIRGFAVTLTIGILASMFSAILVTRVLFRWGIDLNFLRKLSFLNLVKATKFDFLGKRRICGVISLALFAVSMIGFVSHREDALGIDFTGGTIIQFQLGDAAVPVDEVKKTLDSLPLTRAAYPQEVNNIATGSLLSIRVDAQDVALIEDKLRETFPLLGERQTGPDGEERYVVQASKEEISSLAGSGFVRESLLALGLGLLGIFLYITVRFEVSFAVGGFVAILHDVIISVGIIVLFGGELSLIHVGAILTIAGYSINDTIVVFDRIRDTLLYRHGKTEDVMNEAINATLSRTLLTSATTIVTVAILSIFGGAGLRDFSIMILIGLVVGTYSSVFVAAPITLWWSNRKGGSLRKDVLATTVKAETISAAP
ncbi:MAG: protein translocase subunit SecD [Akkermansiaceae bacterium]